MSPKWVVLLGIVFGVLLIRLAHAQELPTCCGATMHRPPMDSVRFGQLAPREWDGHMHHGVPSYVPEASYAPSFGLYGLEEQGYNPETGRHTPYIQRPWHRVEKEWESERRVKRGQRR